ncbi:MAG: hypothetical protein ACREOO_06130 [bacterium]
MNSHSSNLQEMIVHLCRQFREAFGASYCRIALLPETAKAAANGVVHGTAGAGVTDQEVTLIHMDGKSSDDSALAQQNGNATEQTNAPPSDMASSIVTACRKPKPVLRFYVQQASDAAPATAMSAFLDLAFASPRHFSTAEVMAMMLMVEMTRAVLVAAWARHVQASAAERVVGTLQINLFALPFLEAKKQWIDAFEEEYLRQQLMKYYGNISKAARAARISRYTLYALLNKFQFSARSFKKSKISRSAAKASLHAAVAANGPASSEGADSGVTTTQIV